MYSELSKFYDILMYDCDYEKWSQYFYSHISLGRSGKICGLEIGCGSGEMTIRLKKMGLDICGLDISPEMLEKAYLKALSARTQVMFLEGSCVDFEYKQNLDFVISPIDCLSYVSDCELEKTFQNVHRHLKTGGVFLFDIRSEHELKTNHDGKLFFEDAGDLCWFWENKLDGDRVEMDITIFQKEEGNGVGELFSKHVEKQTFFIHQTDRVVQMLERAGFSNIQLFASPNGEEFFQESPKLAVVATASTTKQQEEKI